MEEADARLQEVVASLLNEHGGNHEQALRQTFACLHNSGLYEAQSAAEEEQREQQVRFVRFCARGAAAGERERQAERERERERSFYTRTGHNLKARVLSRANHV